MTEEKATAVLMANLKGAKKKPSNLLDVAKACRLLIVKWGIKKVSGFFKVSEYQLRQIDKINELNPNVQKLVEQGKFGIEDAYQLWRLGGKRQSEVAKEALAMKSHEIRQLVHLLKKNESMSVKEAKQLTQQVLDKKINILMLPLTEETYLALKKLASKRNQNIHDVALKALEEYINER